MTFVILGILIGSALLIGLWWAQSTIEREVKSFRIGGVE